MGKTTVTALGEDLQAYEDAKKAGMRTAVSIRSGEVKEPLDAKKRNEKILKDYEKFKKSLKAGVRSEDFLAKAFLGGFKAAYFDDDTDI